MVTSSHAPYVSFLVTERSEISLLKKQLKQAGTQAGLPPYRLAELDIIASEIASNTLKHADVPGEILFRPTAAESNPGIEIISIDHGPGMYDTVHLMQDGVSTTGTMGTGLGAIRRLSDQFDLYSRRDWGTLLLSRVFRHPTPLPKVGYATLLRAYPGEDVCGDGFSYKRDSDRHVFLVTDGLGHGSHAHRASARAAEAFQQTPLTHPTALIERIHERIARTRGAVGLVLTLDQACRTIDYCGIGNISLHQIRTNEKTKHGISAHGILGQNMRHRLANTSFTWANTRWLVMHSDGIRGPWNLDHYPGLLERDPALVAATLYKDFQRGKDDCAILVIHPDTL